MTASFFKTILILPGTVLVYIPAFLIWMSQGTAYAATLPPLLSMRMLAGVVLGAAGFVLMVWTMRLFAEKGGGGTPAPWEPIRNLIVQGPYRYMRNPMLTGVILTLAAEAVLLWSLPIGLWMLLFFVANTAYFALFEEPGLEKRFGDPYRAYKAEVPRWLPRRTPYEAQSDEN